MNKYAAKIRASRNTKQGQGTEEARGAIFIGMIVEVLSEELTFELRNEQSKEVTFISANSRCKGPGVGPRLVFSFLISSGFVRSIPFLSFIEPILA